MKKLLLILSITLISNLIFAAFPINEKSQTESAQISNFGDNDNRNILLLALATLPLGAFTVVVALSLGGAATYLAYFLALLTFSSPVYSIYLNLNVPVRFWDWRNYFAFLLSVILVLMIVGFASF